MRYRFNLLLLVILCSVSVFGQLNISTVGTLSYSNYLSDIWGYQKANGDELALVTTVDGFSVVDISTPSTPNEIFFKASSKPDTWWRDVKTWDKYAYVVTEASEGLYIVDLEALPGTVTDKYYTGISYPFTRAHNIYIDENGVAYIFGANYSNGGVIMLDVATDPMNPIELGVYDDYYVHDGVVRGDTLWASCINNGFQAVIDVSNKANATLEASWFTPNNFAHNCWPSDDGNYLFTTDEKPGAYITSYDVSNISNAVELDRIRSGHGSNTVPHNVHFMNDYLITSYYNDGVLIHDATHPDYLVETGYVDTEPAYSGDAGGSPNDYYWGAWGVYPWLPSGLIIVSDVQTGLHVLSPNYTRASFVEGVVTDSCGNTLSGVSVQILVDGTIASTQTDGSYLIGTVNSGQYDLQFSKSGYETVTVQNITLTNGVDAQLNVMLGATGFDYLSASITVDEFECANRLTANGLGGDSNYSYLWNNSATTASVSGLSAGNYALTVSDGLGCEDVVTISVAGITALYVSVSSVDPTCGSSDGSISVLVTSGTSPYNYLWEQGETANTVSGLSSGSYTVTVSDMNGCLQTVQENLSSSGAPAVSVTSNTSVTCNGGSNGASSVVASGTTSSYTFIWSEGTIQQGTTSSVTGLEAGIYTLEVEDLNSCSAFQNITIEESEPVLVDITTTSPDCFGENNGSAIAIATGGAGAYSYYWSDVSTQSTQTAINLLAGPYTVSVYDANSCFGTDTVTITEPDLFATELTVTDSVLCYGQEGLISLGVSGGTTPYSITWGDEASGWSGIGPHSVTLSESSMEQYSHVSMDANGCESIDSVLVVSLSSLSLLVPDTIGFCDGDDVVICVNGYGGKDINDYVYNWSTGDVSVGVISSCAELTPTASQMISITLNDNCTLADTGYVYIAEAPSVDCIDGVSELENGAINIYPNPFLDVLTVEFHQQAYLELQDMTGRTVFTQELSLETTKLQLGTIPQGVYFISVRNSEGAFFREQLIKQ